MSVHNALTLLIYVALIGSGTGQNLTAEEAVLKLSVMQQGYKRFVPPTEGGAPAEVFCGMDILDIDGLLGAETSFSIVALVRLQWRDKRLTLNAFTSGRLLTLPFFLEREIWKPRLGFMDASKVQSFGAAQTSKVTGVTKDGLLVLVQRYVFTVSCVMDFRGYPLGTQHCPFRIKAQRDTAVQVRLRWLSELKPGMANIEWLKGVIHSKVNVNTTTEMRYSITGEESVLTARFAFVRDPWPRLLGTWLPSVLAVFAAWMIPWFPEGGLFLPSAALLCVSLHTAHFKAQLQGKDLMTSFDIWLLLCTLLVLGAFLYGVLATSSRPKLWSVTKLMVETDPAPVERTYVAHGYKLTVDASTQTPLTAAAGSDSRRRRLARRAFPVVFAANVVLFWTYVAFIANKGHL